MYVTIDRALQTLAAIDRALAPEVRVVITGGGFVTLEFPSKDVPLPVRRSAEFLTQVHNWVREQTSVLVDTLRTCGSREFLVGVDVMVGQHGSGQFGLWIGRMSSCLIAKRFPVGKEAVHLAGMDALDRSCEPRIVNSVLGRAMVLVCHDAQAFNHRNRALVGRALRETPRARAIAELADLVNRERPTWMWNVIHWIGGEDNLRTFRKSHKQIHSDLGWHPKVIGAFGYEPRCSGQVAVWMSHLRQPLVTHAVVVIVRDAMTEAHVR